MGKAVLIVAVYFSTVDQVLAAWGPMSPVPYPDIPTGLCSHLASA